MAFDVTKLKSGDRVLVQAASCKWEERRFIGLLSNGHVVVERARTYEAQGFHPAFVRPPHVTKWGVLEPNGCKLDSLLWDTKGQAEYRRNGMERGSQVVRITTDLGDDNG